MRWARYVARMGERRRKPEEKKLLERFRRRLKERIKMDRQEVGCGDMEWIEVAKDRDRWRALVNVLMNVRAP